MPTAIIADDEPIMREMLREQLALLWPDLEVVAEEGDGVAALRSIQKLRPDVAFLDIRMPELTGLEVARSLTVPTQVVFVTGYDHGIEAIELNAAHYLLKPVEIGKLRDAVARLQSALEITRPNAAPPTKRYTQHLHVELSSAKSGSEKRVMQIDVDDVRYFQSDSKATLVVTDTVRASIAKTLKGLLSELDERWFVQVSRDAIVNRRHVHAIHRVDRKMRLELRGHVDRIMVTESHQHLFKAD
ncbi:LytTR family DNA-binding domain-containing protein [Paraburkholderia sp. J8-2]|uniref:LytR/AlgR family response regulator transcription factor n=1 Tax=Paraburkholderia sp. J8-2 TaxID=2805440 RepID=UPI002AB7BB17|nr:LytTR family DNA-binding domain-containing protein [Paraburkholderia sp. J8-2]